jgi:hypothetical protein
MLEQAIIDAEQLKETAQRTAEEAVIEKYQSEIKEAVNAILEQEEPMEEEAAMVIDEEGTKIVEDLPSAQLTEEDEIVEINLDQLEEMMAKEIEEGEANAADMLEREEVVEGLEEELDEEIELDEDINDLLEEEEIDEATIEIDDDKLAAAITGQLDEEIEIDEAQLAEVIADILSEAGAELGPDLDDAEEEEAEAAELAAEALEEVEVVEEAEGKKPETKEEEELGKRSVKAGRDDNPNITAADRGLKQESKLLQKENKTLLREQKKMNNKVQLLENKVEKYGTVIEQLKEKLDESNLTNAKLLYQNRILNSISLNERQKDKIVEAISNATTVEEAKIIFETLQSAVGIKSKKTRKQESLNEVVTRSSSAFIPRKEVKPNTNAFSERMQRLAGLK